MPRCSGCSGDRCSCVIQAGENVTVAGAGTYVDPFVITAAAGEGGGGGWSAGDIKMSAVATPPAGWLIANGAAVSRSSYAGLFGAISTSYGAGDNATTFNLPDLAGRFPLGADGSHAHGDVGGNEGTILDAANLPQHTHTIAHIHSINHSHGGADTATESANHAHSATALAAGDHQHGYDTYGNVVAMVPNNGGPGQRAFLIDPITRATSVDGQHPHPVSMGIENTPHQHVYQVPDFSGVSGGASNGNSGGGNGLAAAPFSNMPPWTGVTYLIKT